MQRRGVVAALAALLVVGVAGSASAKDVPKLRMEKLDVSRYPVVKAFVTYYEPDGRIVTGKTREEFKLYIDSNDVGKAADVKPVEQTGEPIFVVIVVQNSNMMADLLETEKNGVKQLIAAANEMKGSKVAILSYAQDTKRVHEFADKPEKLEEKLGKLAIDTDGTETNVLNAVRTAIDLLNTKEVPDDGRKQVIVFSDGVDSSGSEKKVFADLGKRALLNKIAINTIGYNAFKQLDKLKFLGELAKQSNGTERVCQTAQEVSAQFRNAADEIQKQYVVLFQAPVKGLGQEHTIQVYSDYSGGQPIYSNNITAICEDHDGPEPAGPSASGAIWKQWWFWAAIGGGVLLLLIIIIAATRGGSKEEGIERGPQEVGPNGYGAQGGMGQESSFGAPQMSGGGAMRTMALNVAEIQGKGPTVGWIVGISGRYADKTFKLKAGGRTTIGSAADSDVVVDDNFMSGKHCEVRYDGQTYKIVDLGSSNGVILNDKKIMQGELVDGDTIRLGQTEFKFKSIN